MDVGADFHTTKNSCGYKGSVASRPLTESIAFSARTIDLPLYDRFTCCGRSVLAARHGLLHGGGSN